MRALRLLTAAAVCSLFFACTPSPDKVCSHVVDVLQKDSKDKDKDKKGSDDDIKKFKDSCATDMQKMKDKDSAQYATCAKCIMAVDKADDLFGDKCDKECPKSKDEK